MSTQEYAALGALVILFFIVLWWTRRSSRRAKRAPVPSVPPHFYLAFETRALGIATSLLQAAREYLDGERARVALESKELAERLRTTRALCNKLRELRSESSPDEHRHHEWDYLAASAGERYPLLAAWLADLDQPSLERAAQSDAELATSLKSLVDEASKRIQRAESVLAEEGSLLWTQLDLMVLTLLMMDPDPEEQLAATRRLELRPERPEVVAELRDGLSLALDLIHATPRSERQHHDDLRVPAVDDLELGAALVRHRINRAKERDDLQRARALILGDVDLLWLALAVVEKTNYPEGSAPVYGQLAALTRKWQQGDESAEEELREAAQAHFDDEAAAALVESVRQIRAGNTSEELFGGASFEWKTP